MSKKWIMSNLVSAKGELGTASLVGPGISPALINAIYEIQNLLLEKNEVDLATAQTYNAFITKNDQWSEAVSKSPASYFIPLDPKDTVVSVTAQDGHNAYIAFLTSTAHTGNTTPSYAEGTARITIPAGETLEIAKPDDATYLNVAKQYDGVTLTPVKVEITHTKDLGVVEETVTGATPSFEAEENHLYICGELTSLTVTDVPDSGIFEILFTSGNTATEVTLPLAVLLPAGFSFEADTIYDLSVRMYTVGGDTYGLAAVQGWSVPSA